MVFVTFRDHLMGLSVSYIPAAFSWHLFYLFKKKKKKKKKIIWPSAQAFDSVENQLFQLNGCIVSQFFLYSMFILHLT